MDKELTRKIMIWVFIFIVLITIGIMLQRTMKSLKVIQENKANSDLEQF
jgi:hypothetical protein